MGPCCKISRSTSSDLLPPGPLCWNQVFPWTCGGQFTFRPQQQASTLPVRCSPSPLSVLTVTDVGIPTLGSLPSLLSVAIQEPRPALYRSCGGLFSPWYSLLYQPLWSFTCGSPSLEWFVPFLSEWMPLQGHYFCALERTHRHNTVSSRCHTDRASTLLGKVVCLILQRHSVIETLLPSKLFDLLSQLGKEAGDNVPLWWAKVTTHIFSFS